MNLNGEKKMSDESTKSIRELAEVMKKRSFCNKECKYYRDCPLQPISCDPVNEVNGKFPCQLKSKDVDFQRTFLNLFLEGHAGMASEMLVSILKFKDNIDWDNKTDVRAYLELLMKVNKEVYGSAKQIENNDDIEVNIKEVARATPIYDIKNPETKTMTHKKSYEIPESTDPESIMTEDYLVNYITGNKKNKENDE